MRIENPCSESWEAMEGTGAVRHCVRCATSVTDVDAADEAAALALLRTGGCARGRVDASGRLLRLLTLAGAAAAATLGDPSAFPPAKPSAAASAPTPAAAIAAAPEFPSLGGLVAPSKSTTPENGTYGGGYSPSSLLPHASVERDGDIVFETTLDGLPPPSGLVGAKGLTYGASYPRSSQ